MVYKHLSKKFFLLPLRLFSVGGDFASKLGSMSLPSKPDEQLLSKELEEPSPDCHNGREPKDGREQLGGKDLPCRSTKKLKNA